MFFDKRNDFILWTYGLWYYLALVVYAKFGKDGTACTPDSTLRVKTVCPSQAFLSP